jgi:hypothetical protein
MIDGKLHEPVERVSDRRSSRSSSEIVTQLLRSAQGPTRPDGQPWDRVGQGRLPRCPRAALIGFRTEFLTETRGTGDPAPHRRPIRAVVRGPADAGSSGSLVADRTGADDHLRATEPPGAGLELFVGPERRGLRGDDHRRERAVRGHGRQPDQVSARSRTCGQLDGRGAGPADPSEAAVSGAGARVHPGGRVRRGHARKASGSARRVLGQAGAGQADRAGQAGQGLSDRVRIRRARPEVVALRPRRQPEAFPRNRGCTGRTA